MPSSSSPIFNDENKRTGVLELDLFLDLNGWELHSGNRGLALAANITDYHAPSFSDYFERAQKRSQRPSREHGATGNASGCLGPDAC